MKGTVRPTGPKPPTRKEVFAGTSLKSENRTRAKAFAGKFMMTPAEAVEMLLAAALDTVESKPRLVLPLEFVTAGDASPAPNGMRAVFIREEDALRIEHAGALAGTPGSVGDFVSWVVQGTCNDAGNLLELTEECFLPDEAS